MHKLHDIPLGEFFEFEGETYVPVEGGCRICASDGDSALCNKFECMRYLRKDKKSVAFITEAKYINQLRKSMR